MGSDVTQRTRVRRPWLVAARAVARPVTLAIWIGASALTSAAMAQPAQPRDTAAPAGVTAIDAPLAGDRTRTRFIIGLEKAVDYQVFSLANPQRVIVELPDVKLQLPTLPASGAVGLVQSFFGGLSAPGKTRVIIDVTTPVVVEKAVLERGRDGRANPRLVLEMVPVAPGKAPSVKGQMPPPMGVGAATIQPPMPRAAQRPLSRETSVYKPLIVIDPGHGGKDTGAQKYGTVEKDVVLAFAHKLREKLVATGRYRVLMTRETDVFVELDERRAFGDRHKAALFIAVHADYAGSSARGATIYSLRDATSRSLQRSAKEEAQENVLSSKEREAIVQNRGDVDTVASILKDLGKREIEANADRTQLFSKSVIEFMGGSTPMMNNPDREANFRVLKSAKTPSVLIELAYVTNAEDARNLRSDAWRDRVAGSLLTAIENYFSYKEARLPM